MTYIIPNQSTKELKQPNSSDLAGSLFVTKNINLDDEGYIKLSPPAVAVMTTDNDADFDTCDSLFVADNEVFFNSSNVFSEGDIAYSPFTDRGSDTDVPTPGAEEDGIYFNDVEVISDGANIFYRSASTTWTAVSTSLTTSVPTALGIFDNLNSLVVGNNNTVKLVNTSWAVSATVLTLAPDYIVTSVDSNGDVIYIGTRHKGNGEAKLFLWDGAGTTFTASYGAKTFEISSVKAYGSSVVVVTSLGQLLRFNGGGFDELANLPSYYFTEEWADSSNDNSRISNRGMVVDGDLIYIRLDSRNESKIESYKPYFPGGLWCYDPKVGLYNKSTPSYTRITSDTILTGDVNTTTDVITVSAAPVTGTPVLYDHVGATSIVGLQEGKLYYVIYVSATTIKLATSKANADAGTAINLTGTGNSSQVLLFYTPNDYGWSYAFNRGAVGIMTSSLFDSYYSGRIVYTADLFAKTTAGTEKTVANVHNFLLPNRGYFITPRLYSSNIEDSFPKLYIKTKPLNTDDEIVIKYKVVDKVDYPIGLRDTTTIGGWTGTWTDTNTFTTTRDMSRVVAGEEIEIIAGVGAGFLAHISSISEAGGTYTVNLDESFIWAAASDIMYFTVDNWTRTETTLTSSTDTNANGYFEVPLAEKGSFIQVKVELRGIDVTIAELQIYNGEYRNVV